MARFILSALLCLWISTGYAATVPVVKLEGVIGPATADFVVRQLDQAVEAQAPFVILTIDTPGGLDTSMRKMIKAVISSPIPVVGYVAPNGARAASAGTYLLMATQVAAMAPATNLGAATPIQLGMPGLPSPADKPDKKNDQKDQKSNKEESQDSPPAASALERKMVNDAAAYMRSLAQLRGRNAKWAEEAVRRAASISAEEALRQHVIDLIAATPADLLKQLNGRQVQVAGHTVTLSTDQVVLETVQPDWRFQLLAVITNPNVAYILMLLGIYGLLLEFYHPGTGIPGVTGAICLLLAGYALQMLPLSYAGLGLLLLGIVLMVAEAFTGGVGVLGIGGVVAFALGSVMLMDTNLPGYQIAWPLIAAFTLVSALVCMMVLTLVVKARQRPQVAGITTLIGAPAEVIEPFLQGRGRVRINGEIWSAVCDDGLLEPGDWVIITEVEGLILTVTRQS